MKLRMWMALAILVYFTALLTITWWKGRKSKKAQKPSVEEKKNSAPVEPLKPTEHSWQDEVDPRR